MNIYEQEKQDGLEQALSSKASVSYACLLEPSKLPNINKSNINNKTIAAADDKDLYYVQSILVTSSWNKNDDIFDKNEVWAARKTPEDKPTNLEHDEATIIGHITENWPITEDGILIDESTPVENLPDKFHILTGAVIYRGFSNPELAARASNLIEEIENGTKYVSMECYFRGFDYGLTNNETGEFKVVARSEETSYLTKHLRAYGGLGEHEGYKVGRVLRDITFSGKGYVDKPANPDSIILTKKNEEEKNAAFIKAGVTEESTSNTETNTMNLEKEIADLQHKVEAMSGCGDAVKEAYTLASSLKDRVSELETSLAEEKATNETLASQLSEAQAMSDEEKKKKEEEMKKMQASVEELEEAVAAYKNKEEEMKKKEAMMKRKASLLDLGIESEVADATVEKFAALDDETFAAMSDLLSVSAKKQDKEEEMKKEKMKAAEEALESAEPEAQVDLSVGSESEETEVESTRAALVDFMYNRLNKAQPNKGE